MTISRIIAGRQQKIIKKEGRRVATFYFICAGTAQFGIIIWEVSGTRSMYVYLSSVMTIITQKKSHFHLDVGPTTTDHRS